MADPASKALKAYQDKVGKRPRDAAALVAFAKTNNLKAITQEQAKAVLNNDTAKPEPKTVANKKEPKKADDPKSPVAVVVQEKKKGKTFIRNWR